MDEESCAASNQRITDKERIEDDKIGDKSHPAKPSIKMAAAADDATGARTTGGDLPKTRSSLIYGKPEIQEVDRSAAGHSGGPRTGHSGHDDFHPVRSDIV